MSERAEEEEEDELDELGGTRGRQTEREASEEEKEEGSPPYEEEELHAPSEEEEEDDMGPGSIREQDLNVRQEARTGKGEKANQRNQVFAATPKFGFKQGQARSGGRRAAHRRHNSIKSSCDSSARGKRGSVVTKRVFEVGRAVMWGSGKDGRCGNGKEQSERVPSELN